MGSESTKSEKKNGSLTPDAKSSSTDRNNFSDNFSDATTMNYESKMYARPANQYIYGSLSPRRDKYNQNGFYSNTPYQERSPRKKKMPKKDAKVNILSACRGGDLEEPLLQEASDHEIVIDPAREEANLHFASRMLRAFSDGERSADKESDESKVRNRLADALITGSRSRRGLEVGNAGGSSRGNSTGRTSTSAHKGRGSAGKILPPEKMMGEKRAMHLGTHERLHGESSFEPPMDSADSSTSNETNSNKLRMVEDDFVENKMTEPLLNQPPIVIDHQKSNGLPNIFDDADANQMSLMSGQGAPDKDTIIGRCPSDSKVVPSSVDALFIARQSNESWLGGPPPLHSMSDHGSMKIAEETDEDLESLGGTTVATLESVADWYEILRPGGSGMTSVPSIGGVTRGLMVLFVEELYFYTVAGYYFTIMFLGGLFYWCNEDMTFTDALYSSVSNISQAGLSICNWPNLKFSSHVVSLFLMFAGSMPFLSCVPPLLRRYNFRKQNQVFNMRPTYIPQRLQYQWSLEYQALGKVVTVVLVYVFCNLLFGFWLLVAYFAWDDGGRVSANRAWEALYLTISSFHNNGLVISPNSVEQYKADVFPLYVSGFLILLGNTAYPIALRLILMAGRYLSKEDKEVYTFLLDHPRRCFTHLFPVAHTLWLFCMVCVLTTFTLLVIIWQDGDGSPAMHGTHYIFSNAWYQAVSARTAGLNSVDLYRLTLTSNFCICVCMYISTSPTVVIMRYTNDLLPMEDTQAGAKEAFEAQINAQRNAQLLAARRHTSKDIQGMENHLALLENNSKTVSFNPSAANRARFSGLEDTKQLNNLTCTGRIQSVSPKKNDTTFFNSERETVLIEENDLANGTGLTNKTDKDILAHTNTGAQQAKSSSKYNNQPASSASVASYASQRALEEERAAMDDVLDVVDITGIAEGVEMFNDSSPNTVKEQAKRYMLQHTVYLVVVLFFILVFEQNHFDNSKKDDELLEEHGEEIVRDAYDNLQFFKVIYEMASAYGTVGLSLGGKSTDRQKYVDGSYSAIWVWQSKLLLCFVMFLGKLRGMPDSIDPSVAVRMRKDVNGRRRASDRRVSENNVYIEPNV